MNMRHVFLSAMSLPLLKRQQDKWERLKGTPVKGGLLIGLEGLQSAGNSGDFLVNWLATVAV